MAGCGQVERHSTRLQAHEEHPHVGVVGECADGLVSCVHGHGSLQTDAFDPGLGQSEMAQVQHGGELGEDDALRAGVGRNHPAQAWCFAQTRTHKMVQ